MKKDIMVSRFSYNALTVNLNADSENSSFYPDLYHTASEVLVTCSLPAMLYNAVANATQYCKSVFWIFYFPTWNNNKVLRFVWLPCSTCLGSR